MPKPFLRLVSALLTFCLLADPSLAVAFSQQQSIAGPINSQSDFQEQALSVIAVGEHKPLSEKPGSLTFSNIGPTDSFALSPLRLSASGPTEKLMFGDLRSVEEKRREDLVGHIHGLGVNLWGSQWATTDYLERYLGILKNLPHGDPREKPRRLVFLPWQIVPLSYFVYYWAIVPFMISHTILLLPNAASFEFLAAFDAAHDYFRRNPSRVCEYASNIEEAAGILATKLVDESKDHAIPMSSRRWGSPLPNTMTTLSIGYIWLILAVGSHWQPEIIGSPLRPIMILAASTGWVVLIFKPLSIWIEKSTNRTSPTLFKRSSFQVARWMPVWAMVISFIISSLVYVPGEQQWQLKPPTPFAPLMDMIREYREAQSPPPQEEIQKKAATPLYFKPNPTPAPNAPKAITLRDKPKQSIPKAVTQTPKVQLPEVATEKEEPVPDSGHPGVMKLVATYGSTFTGTISALKYEFIQNYAKLSEDEKMELLTQIDALYKNGRWTPDQKLVLSIADPTESSKKYTITELRLYDEAKDAEHPAAPPLPNLQMLKVCEKIVAQIKPSLVDKFQALWANPQSQKLAVVASSILFVSASAGTIPSILIILPTAFMLMGIGGVVWYRNRNTAEKNDGRITIEGQENPSRETGKRDSKTLSTRRVFMQSAAALATVGGWATPSVLAGSIKKPKAFNVFENDLGEIPKTLRMSFVNDVIQMAQSSEMQKATENPQANVGAIAQMFRELSTRLLDQGYLVVFATQKVDGVPVPQMRAAVLHLKPQVEMRTIGTLQSTIHSIDHVSGYVEGTAGELGKSVSGSPNAYIYDARISDIAKRLQAVRNSPQDENAWNDLKDFMLFTDPTARHILLDAFLNVPDDQLATTLRDYVIRHELIHNWAGPGRGNAETLAYWGSAATSSEPYLHLLLLAQFLNAAGDSALPAEAMQAPESEASLTITASLINVLAKEKILSESELHWLSSFDQPLMGSIKIRFLLRTLLQKEISKSRLQKILKDSFEEKYGALPSIALIVETKPLNSRRDLYDALLGAVFGKARTRSGTSPHTYSRACLAAA